MLLEIRFLAEIEYFLLTVSKIVKVFWFAEVPRAISERKQSTLGVRRYLGKIQTQNTFSVLQSVSCLDTQVKCNICLK